MPRTLSYWKRALRFPHVAPETSIGLQDILLTESRVSLNYLVLVLASCAIATLGLLANSAAVIIGAMIIAPLMLPIRGLALGALTGNIKLFENGLWTVVVGTGVGIGFSCLLGLVVGLPDFGSEILARTQPNLLDLGIALAAGAIGAFAKVRQSISDSLAGVAIAVALMPPVCVIGLSLARLNGELSWGAALLYGTNLLGIALACMIVFLFLGFAPFQQARKVLLLTALFTALLIIPLGASFLRLLTQSRLEKSLEQVLTTRTLTFQQIRLLSSEFNWLTNPPTVTLSVASDFPIAANQVQLLEEFARQATQQPFTLVLQVSTVTEVRSEAICLRLNPQ